MRYRYGGLFSDGVGAEFYRSLCPGRRERYCPVGAMSNDPNRLLPQQPVASNLFIEPLGGTRPSAKYELPTVDPFTGDGKTQRDCSPFELRGRSAEGVPSPPRAIDRLEEVAAVSFDHELDR